MTWKRSTFFLALVPSLILGSTFAQAKLSEPVQLTFGEGAVIDTRGDMTYAGPLLGDIDADGDDDLIVTTITGVFLLYLNEAAAEEKPRYGERQYLKNRSGERIKISNW